MGLIITFILVSIIVGLLVHWATAKEEGKKECAIIGVVVSCIILTIATVVTISNSYNSSVVLRETFVTIEQYKEAIELYAEKGVAEFRSGNLSSEEFTDLKYNQYQQQIGRMIRDLRDTIVKYNTKLTGKQVMNAGWFYGWVIIVPDGLETVRMADYVK